MFIPTNLYSYNVLSDYIYNKICSVSSRTNIKKISYITSNSANDELELKFNWLKKYDPKIIIEAKPITVNIVDPIESILNFFIHSDKIELTLSNETQYEYPYSDYEELLKWIAIFENGYFKLNNEEEIKKLLKFESELVIYKYGISKISCIPSRPVCVELQSSNKVNSDITIQSSHEVVPYSLYNYITDYRINIWNSRSATTIIAVGKPFILFIKLNEINDIKEVIHDIPLKYIIYFIPKSSLFNAKILSTFGLNDGSYCIIVYLEYDNIEKINTITVKYVYNIESLSNDLSKKKLLSWITSVDKKEVPPFWKSEEPFDVIDKNYPVNFLVAKTFISEVIDSKVDYVVDYFAPWCGHCRIFFPIFENIAYAFKELNYNYIKFGRLDATANDTYKRKIYVYQTVIYYQKINGTIREHIMEDNPKNESDLLDWLLTFAPIKIEKQKVLNQIKKLKNTDIPQILDEL